MKPFDLEAAKRGEPIVTRDGREAKFIAYVPEVDKDMRVIFRVGKELWSVPDNGKIREEGKGHVDLFMAPKKRIVWLNFYPNSTSAAVHDTEERADRYAVGKERIGGKAYPVEIEE